MDSKERDLYLVASLLAYGNSLDLLEEANILHKHSRLARAYALAELSLEEFAKAFLYRCYAAGLLTDKEFHRDLTLHEEKLFHAIHLMATASLWSQIMGAIEHDAGVRNHSRHILLKKIREVSTSGSIERVVDLLKDANKRKMSALYVEVDRKHQRVLTTDRLQEDEVAQLLGFMNSFAHGFDIILKGSDDARFAKEVELLDPQILSGTMKSDYTKFTQKGGDAT